MSKETQIRECHGFQYLHDAALYIKGARDALQNIDNTKAFDNAVKDNAVYNRAIYDLLMSDEKSLMEWLTGRKAIEYYDHETNKKGRLVKCKAKMI